MTNREAAVQQLMLLHEINRVTPEKKEELAPHLLQEVLEKRQKLLQLWPKAEMVWTDPEISPIGKRISELAQQILEKDQIFMAKVAKAKRHVAKMLKTIPPSDSPRTHLISEQA